MQEKDNLDSFESNDFWLLTFIAAAIVFFIFNTTF
jgi:hypothetical protein